MLPDIDDYESVGWLRLIAQEANPDVEPRTVEPKPEPPQEQTVADNPLLHVDDDSSDICEECGHLIGLHKVDGCESDRNIEVEEGFEMSGACGCQAYTTDDGSGYAYSREFNSKP